MEDSLFFNTDNPVIPVEEEPEHVIPKKRGLNEKLREAFNKGRADYNIKQTARKIANQEIQEQHRLERLKLYEDNIKKKALSIIKREIKEEYRLSQVVDDNTPEIEIQKMRTELQKPKPKPPPPPPSIPEYIFV